MQDSERLPRKLAAVLYADVAGYARLTGADEDATHRRLSTYLDLISSAVADHRGRVMHYAGDAVLAMFEAAVDALSCAAHIQKGLGMLNESLPDELKIQFRIGINLGDVIEDRDDIYGDGVNVAARLESLAQPGGICISEAMRTAVGDKLGLSYRFLGEQQVKNIAQPVRAYHVVIEPSETPRNVPGRAAGRRLAHRFGVVAGAGVLLVAAAGVGVWQWLQWPSEVGSGRPALPDISDRQSIAVLPFTNMSADSEQEYFADGMTDDLITDLSNVSGLFVIARNSVFTYKGKHAKVQDVAKDLGVRYVLEGSVRRMGDNVRINAQLIDATTGGHLWAERYDGQLADVFELQDQVTEKIVAALQVELSPKEVRKKIERDTSNIAAYDAFLRGWGHLLRKTPEDAAEAITFFQKALELDPDYSRAYAALAQTYWDNCLDETFTRLTGLDGHGDNTSYSCDVIAWNYLENAKETPLSQSHALRARMLQRARRFDEAMEEAREAVALGPSDPAAYDVLIENLIYSGKPREAIGLAEETIDLDPNLPAEKLFLKGMAHYSLGRLEEALSYIDRARRHNPAQTRYAAVRAATLVELGRIRDARAALEEYLRGLLSYTTVNWTMYNWPFQTPEIARRFAGSLLEAGLRPSPKAYYVVTENERLTGDEIAALVSGKTMTGIDRGPTGLEDELEVTRDDKAQIVAQGYLTYFRDGVSRIENNLLCDPWWDFGTYCVAVYRNPDGARSDKDEYVFFTLAGIFTFSVFEPAG